MSGHASERIEEPAPGGEGARRWYVRRVARYLLAGIGPVTLAGTHFAISFAMLRLESPAAFGIFTFLFVAAQFTVSLAAALFGAPLQALPAAAAHDPADPTDPADRDAAAAAIVTATMLLAIGVGIAFTVLALVVGLWGSAAAWYGLYTATMILRWVGRAWSYATDRPWRSALSDLAYGAVALGVFGVFGPVAGGVPESACYAALALGSTLSLVAFGRRYFALLLARPSLRAARAYRVIWRSQSRWALLGVVTMEAVANVHIYLVTLVAGAVAVAPLAAAALLLRPINVVQNALIDVERPQMAQLIAARSLAELRRTTRLFLGVLLMVWLVSATLALGVVRLAPALFFSPDYDLAVVDQATLSWVLVTLLVLLQVPSNAMLQAAGDFRPLARATIWSALVNISAVALALALFDPVWTIAAMALGWLVDLALVRRAAGRRWAALRAGVA